MMGQNLSGLPRDLECSDGRFNLDIQDHKIIDMMVYYENIYDEGYCHLFNFVAACINYREDTWIFKSFEEQGLTVKTVANICIAEIKKEAYALYDVVEHDRTSYSDDCTIAEIVKIKKSMYKKYVDSEIVSHDVFENIWKNSEPADTFASFMKKHGKNVQARCDGALKKSETFKSMTKNLLPIIDTMGKKYKSHMRYQYNQWFKIKLDEKLEKNQDQKRSIICPRT